jgi:ubiquitin-protein ligase
MDVSWFEDFSHFIDLGDEIFESGCYDHEMFLVFSVSIDGAEGSIYEGEIFQLQFLFNDKYPFDSPTVTFVGKHIPEHSHVYSNGHICLSILTDDWTPALSKNMRHCSISEQ